MQTDGDHDGGLYSGMSVYERTTGCCESRRGYEDGSLYGCDDNDIRDAAAAVWFGTPDRYRTGGIISLHQADRSCQGGDIPLLVEEGTVA